MLIFGISLVTCSLANSLASKGRAVKLLKSHLLKGTSQVQLLVVRRGLVGVWLFFSLPECLGENA